MYCRNCGNELPNETKFCPNCGTAQEDAPKKLKYCKHCGEQIDIECVVCPKCGKQVEELKAETPQVVINNSNSNTSSNVNTNVNRNTVNVVRRGKQKNKWVAFALCFFLGYFGAHKFYEGKAGMGILYLFTLGLFGFGWLVDIIVILTKPNPYYV